MPPGGEWIWLEDPWPGAWEKLRVPKEEADYRRRREIPPKPSYWREAEAREWRRRLRKEKEKVEREVGMESERNAEEGLLEGLWKTSHTPWMLCMHG